MCTQGLKGPPSAKAGRQAAGLLRHYYTRSHTGINALTASPGPGRENPFLAGVDYVNQKAGSAVSFNPMALGTQYN